MTSDRPTDLFRISDQQLGQELGVLIAQQTSSNLPYSVIFNQLQDLLGDDTVLRGPLRDLLGRPAFQQLVGLKRHSGQVGSRDALLQDLGLTFSAGMVARLADFIDGCLDLPPRPVPPESQPSASSTTASSASPSTLPRPPQPPVALRQRTLLWKQGDDLHRRETISFADNDVPFDDAVPAPRRDGCVAQP